MSKRRNDNDSSVLFPQTTITKTMRFKNVFKIFPIYYLLLSIPACDSVSYVGTFDTLYFNDSESQIDTTFFENLDDIKGYMFATYHKSIPPSALKKNQLEVHIRDKEFIPIEWGGGAYMDNTIILENHSCPEATSMAHETLHYLQEIVDNVLDYKHKGEAWTNYLQDVESIFRCNVATN